MRWLGLFRRSRYRGRHRHDEPPREYELGRETVVYEDPEPGPEVPRQRIEIGFADGSTALVADPEVVTRLQSAAARLRAATD